MSQLGPPSYSTNTVFLFRRYAPQLGLQGVLWLQRREQKAHHLLDERGEVCGGAGGPHQRERSPVRPLISCTRSQRRYATELAYQCKYQYNHQIRHVSTQATLSAPDSPSDDSRLMDDSTALPLNLPPEL